MLVDAAAGGDPGAISVRHLSPGPAAPTSWSHRLDPEALAGLATALYGRVPPMLVSVTGGSFAEGDRRSGVLERALPTVVGIVEGILAVARGARRWRADDAPVLTLRG